MRLGWFCLLVGYCGLLTAVETHYVGYQVRAEADVYDAYVVKPFGVGRVLQRLRGTSPEVDAAIREGNHRESKKLLERAANFIEHESEYLSHINDNTRPEYNSELFRLRQGHWPTVIVTEAGNPEHVLLTLSIAIQKEPTWLPVQDRFFGRGLETLPRQPEAIEYRISDGDKLDYPFYMLSGGHLHSSPSISTALNALPWIEGGEAELKFFIRSRELRKNLARVAQALVLKHELHRWSATPLPQVLRESQAKYLADPQMQDALKTHFAKLVAGSETAVPEAGRRYVESFLRGIEATLLSGDIQHTIMNSKLFVQSSGPLREGKTTSLTTDLYVKKFGFPSTPTWRFMENDLVGTPGIQTDIFELSLKEYEHQVTRGLILPLLGDLAFVPLLHEQPIDPMGHTVHMPFSNCVHLLSHWHGAAMSLAEQLHSAPSDQKP